MNTIKMYYPDGAIMAMEYRDKSDLLKALKIEAERLCLKFTHLRGCEYSPLPLPRKIIITLDRRSK